MCDGMSVELLRRIEAHSQRLTGVLQELERHCNDSAAHQHEHAVDVDALRAMVDDQLKLAAEAAVEHHESEEHDNADGEPPGEEGEVIEPPPPEPVTVPPEPAEPERPPERTHALHHRIGGSR
jgi:hypothetical protein